MRTMIKPKELRFCLSFTINECHKELSSQCSLDKRFPNDKSIRVTGRSKEAYCQQLYRNIGSTYEDDPIEIIEYECKHYDIQCGRHRICISKKYNLSIPADISKEKGNCPTCNGEDTLI
jgi:hypothetical protein